MKKIFDSARGQIAVLYGAILFVLVGAIALGTDVAVMYMNWQQVQKIADAAAQAGSNFLTGITFSGTPATGCTGDGATQAACTYAVDNGLAAANVTITEPTSFSIKVVATETGLPYYFGKVLGFNTYAVSATAAAQAGGSVGTCKGCGMFPVGLQCTAPCSLSSMDPGQSVAFGSKFVGGLAPGNWQYLDGGGGDSGLASGLASGMPGSYTIGQTIYSEPGNKGNSFPVVTGLAARLADCPTIADPCSGGGNPNNIPAGDPCLVVVPAVDYHGCTGSCTMSIEGFAAIYLEQNSTGTSIQGCFVKTVVADTLATSGAPALGPLVTPTLTE